MNIKSQKNKNQEGFALIVSLGLLLVMTLMGTILVLNANNQSQISGVSESSKQSFLSAESAIQKGMRYLEVQVDLGNYPTNAGSTPNEICNYPLGTDSDITYVNKLSQPVSITAETSLTGNLSSRFTQDTFDYIIRHMDSASSGGGSGVGTGIGMSANYSSVGSTTIYRYKIWGCGMSPGINQNNVVRSIIETIVSVTL